MAWKSSSTSCILYLASSEFWSSRGGTSRMLPVYLRNVSEWVSVKPLRAISLLTIHHHPIYNPLVRPVSIGRQSNYAHLPPQRPVERFLSSRLNTRWGWWWWLTKLGPLQDRLLQFNRYLVLHLVLFNTLTFQCFGKSEIRPAAWFALPNGLFVQGDAFEILPNR